MPRGWRVRRGGPTGRQGLAYRHTGSSDESRDDLSRTPRPPRPGRFLNATRRACPMERATSAIASRRRPLGSTSLVLRRSRREADNDYVRVSPATSDAQIEQPRFRPLPCSPGAPWPDPSPGAGSPRRQYRAFAANRGRGRTPLVGWLRPVERGVAPSALSNPERRANRRRGALFHRRRPSRSRGYRRAECRGWSWRGCCALRQSGRRRPGRRSGGHRGR